METETTAISSSRGSRYLFVLPATIVGFALVYLLAWFLVDGAGRTATLDILNIGGPLIAAGACLLALRHTADRRQKLLWGLLMAAMAASMLGELIWAVYELGLDLTDPFPTVADLFWLLAYPLEFACVISLVSIRRSGRLAVLAVSAGAAFVAVVAGALLALFLIVPSIDSESSLLSNVVTVLYPVGDVLLLAALGALALIPSQTEGKMHGSLSWIAGGFIISVIADIVYATKELNGTYATGSWVDLMWPFFYLLIAVGAVWQLLPVPYAGRVAKTA